MIALGHNIKKLRIEKELSQSDLAINLEVSQTSVAHYEAGTRQPTIETLIKLSTLFGVSVDSLIGAPKVAKEGSGLNKEDIPSQLIELMVSGDIRKVWSLVDQMILKYDIKTILEEMLKLVLYKTGEMWKEGILTEVEEHLISNMVLKIINALSYQNKNVIKTKKAISFVVGSDLHTIGLEMVNTYLESKGVEVHYIGNNLPDRSIQDFINRLKPDYIFISITLESYTNNLLRLLNILHKSIPIYVGGQGIINHELFKDYTNVCIVNELKEITVS